MKTVIFLPPLPRVSGGLAVLLQVGEHLARQGHDVCFALREAMPLPTSVPYFPFDAVTLTPDDLWLVPEGWPNALAPGLAAHARCAVYVQNWAFLLGSLPPGARWERLPVHFLAVSEPVRWFIQETTGRDAALLRPGIDPARFHPPVRTDLAAPVQGVIRIAWMPRKNKVLARQIRDCLEARLPRLHPHIRVEWQEIHNRTPDEVAALFRSSHIFLATGFPEGFALPPLEAMASGCIVVGYAGFGGWDYMRQALPDASFAANPWCPLPDVPWGGNGIFTADADIPGAALALEAACTLVRSGGSWLAQTRANAAATAAAYTLEAQGRAVAGVWKNIQA